MSFSAMLTSRSVSRSVCAVFHWLMVFIVSPRMVWFFVAVQFADPPPEIKETESGKCQYQWNCDIQCQFS